MTSALLAAAAVWLSARRPGMAITARRPPRRRAETAGVLLVGVALVVGAGRVAPATCALLLVVAGAGWMGHRAWGRRAAGKAAADTRRHVLECCELLVSELSAGQPPGGALVLAAQEWSALAPVAQCAALGSDVPTALRRASTAPGASDLALVAAAWQVAHRTGNGLADALARVAATLRQDRATERVVRGELASARATAQLVAALPVLALLIGSGAGGDPFGFLVGSLPGVACLAGGLTFAIAGLAWIERIAAGVGR